MPLRYLLIMCFLFGCHEPDKTRKSTQSPNGSQLLSTTTSVTTVESRLAAENTPLPVSSPFPVQTAPAINPYKDVPLCKANPPRPGDGGWGECLNELKFGHCKAHTHKDNEVAHCKQTDKNIEVHIKCEISSEGHAPDTHASHNYKVFVVNLDCSGIVDLSKPSADGKGFTEVSAPTCAGQKTCCRGGLTNDEDRTFCMKPINRDHIRCNNIFTLCGEGNAGASLSQTDIEKFCKNRRHSTQPSCNYDLVGGICEPMDYSDPVTK